MFERPLRELKKEDILKLSWVPSSAQITSPRTSSYILPYLNVRPHPRVLRLLLQILAYRTASVWRIVTQAFVPRRTPKWPLQADIRYHWSSKWYAIFIEPTLVACSVIQIAAYQGREYIPEDKTNSEIDSVENGLIIAHIVRPANRLNLRVRLNERFVHGEAKFMRSYQQS